MKRFFNVAAEKESCFLLPSVCTFGNSILFPKIKMFFFFSVPGLGRPPGVGNGNPFQYYCLENPMDRGPWWATVHEVAKSDMTK